MITYAYGITTVPQRMSDTLPATLRSLDRAGFGEPHLFVDGFCAVYSGCHSTIRDTRLGAFGNWYLGLLELYIRNPRADRYAIFQDDIIAVSHLRDYLDSVPLPDDNYWNLYAVNATERRGSGFVTPAYLGQGALALVMPREAVRRILCQPSMINKPLSGIHAKKNLDGAVYEAMKRSGVAERCHVPSLVQHTGTVSTLRNKCRKICRTFPGEQFDARTLIQHGTETPPASTPAEQNPGDGDAACGVAADDQECADSDAFPL